MLVDHLGDILWALGKKEEAIESWRLAFWNAGEGDEDVRTTVPEKLQRAGAPLEEGGEGDGEEGGEGDDEGGDGEEGEE